MEIVAHRVRAAASAFAGCLRRSAGIVPASIGLSIASIGLSIASIGLSIGSATLVIGCVIENADTTRGLATARGDAPPNPVAETRPPAPNAQALWTAGYWHWTGVQYTWVPGHWDAPPPETLR